MTLRSQVGRQASKLGSAELQPRVSNPGDLSCGGSKASTDSVTQPRTPARSPQLQLQVSRANAQQLLFHLPIKIPHKHSNNGVNHVHIKSLKEFLQMKYHLDQVFTAKLQLLGSTSNRML